MKKSWILLVLLAATLVWPQNSATIYGRIQWGNGRPVVKAVVKVGNVYDYTDVDGRYRLKGVPYGRHKFRIYYNRQLRREFDLRVNAPRIRRDVVLK